ncbi:gluconokinase [Aureimonas populi]|uniref:Gluconokinase n=1 Tax=Aureimonas populi TaxID=1701758 RepID=A0ABW5CPP3_9HYPH|nr:gluconokinase [Aureimonas populi]
MSTSPQTGEKPVSIIVMGPSSIGKTTTARLIADKLDWIFAEGDEFHPPENIDKMSNGIPLNDEDRAPWLEKIRDWISEKAGEGQDTVLTCSALKRRYRDVLRGAGARVRFVELVAEETLVAERMSRRKGHYMPASLLSSQFAALEMLDEDEDGVKVTVDASPEEVVDRALTELGIKAG